MSAWAQHVSEIGRWMLPGMLVCMLGLRALVRRKARTDKDMPLQGRLLAAASVPLVVADAVVFVLVFATVLHWVGQTALGYFAAFIAGVTLSPLQIIGKLGARG